MATTFFRGMVVDVVNTPSGQAIRNGNLEQYRSIINVPELKSLPRNTAIVKPISRGEAKTTDRQIVCYPFFSSHLCMPLKPGEFVWFIYEDPDDGGQLGYWLSRVSEPNHVEDTNYSFSGRTYVQSPVKSTKKASDRFDGPTVESDELQTYSYTSPTSDPAELARTIEFAKKVHRFEPVPRYTKRPGDMILQGSNNTLIMLGEERGHYASNPGDVSISANFNDIGPDSGAIDIVVGRGRFTSTSGRTIKNEFGIEEIDKREASATEGDAHFPTDSARIYLTALSDDTSDFNPDALLNVQYPNEKGTGAINKKAFGSFVVTKADNLRVVARGSGSIKIVKEPDSESDDSSRKLSGSALMLHDNGTMQLAANEIRLSSYYTDTGADQPYIRYYPLVEFLSAVMKDIETFCTTLSTHVTPGFGAPSPQITAASNILKQTITLRRTQLELNKLGINSETIFGE